jgi:ATP-dependent protease ClpP protease subunit
MNFVEVTNRKGKIKLNDGVYKESADKLIEELETLYGPAAVAANMRIGEIVCRADDALEAVEVEINSPGGSVFEGQRIYNALREMASRGVEITTTVNSIAASMGSVILMAGDKRRMTPGSRIMIHEASTMAMGDAKAMRRTADLLESISAQIAGIYAERTDGDPAEIRELMHAETWMDSDAAIAANFVHEVVNYDKDKKPKNSALDNPLDSNQITPAMSIFAKFFPSAPAEQIEAAQAEIDRIAANYEEAATERDQLRSELSTAMIDNVIANKQIEDLTAEKETLVSEIAGKVTQIEDLTAKLDEAKQSAHIEAQRMLAAAGQPEPLPIGEGEGKDDVLETFKAIADAGERSRFYKANRKAIIAAQTAEMKARYK